MIDRAYMSAHVGRQQREREIRTTTAPIRSDGLTPAQKLDSLAVCGIFGTVMAWLIFTPLAAFITGLTMTAICLTVWVQMRRQG